ncbi:MAG: NADH-quinone oxidoreductase subunit D, partial [Verrucomicrobiaceae bacterium]|nr:NADH-quinone oxidoreductase subunit D [Verrucomicrobiaceae bacterium]
MSETTTYEAPDAAAVAAKAVNDYQAETDDVLGEKMVLNMGPSHPATHGVLRLVLELDGEIIEKAEPHIGYLHRGDEKIAENMHYNQFVPYTDRLDYLAPLANNVAYACAVEKLLDWELPPRGLAVRVPACELSRISSHFLGIAASAMAVGALPVLL